VIAKTLTHLGLWAIQAHSPPRGYPWPSSGQRLIAASSRPPAFLLRREVEPSRRDGCLPAAPCAAASPRSRGARGARRGLLLDMRPRSAISTRPVDQRRRDRPGKAPGSPARRPKKQIPITYTDAHITGDCSRRQARSREPTSELFESRIRRRGLINPFWLPRRFSAPCYAWPATRRG